MSSFTTLSPTDPRLRPNPWNTNVVSPENEAKIEKSLEELGAFKPIIVREIDDESGELGGATALEILGGEHRWRAAQRSGLDALPVYNLGRIPDDQAKKISLVDNARYGVDDSLQLGELLKEIGPIEDLQEFLPYSDVDLSAIFAASDIALDDLDLEEPERREASTPAETATRAAKTHTIMRFKVLNKDAERIAATLGKVMKRQSFTSADELTNAGDALVHVLFADAEE